MSEVVWVWEVRKPGSGSAAGLMGDKGVFGAVVWSRMNTENICAKYVDLSKRWLSMLQC